MWTHLERQKGWNAGKQKLKLTDVLYVIEFPLKDKIKAIDKQMGTNVVIVGLWFVWLW
jgi:hypothetical protein